VLCNCPGAPFAMETTGAGKKADNPIRDAKIKLLDLIM
jgi:hypothetical protein